MLLFILKMFGYNRFSVLRKEADRLKDMITERNKERDALKQEESLRAEIATLRKELSIG